MVEFTHILCPIDLSEMSGRALAHAAALARWYGARLTVLHVVPTFEPMQVRSGDLTGPVHLLYPMPREEVVARLESTAVADAGVDPGATYEAEAGDPVTAIVDRALAIRADLVVMGTHGHRGVKRFFLGSVTERVLREAPCPVLTVPAQTAAVTAAAVVFRKILCPIDFSDSALQAMGFALDLARQSDGTVTLLHAIEWLAEEGPAEGPGTRVEEHRGSLVEGAEARLRALVTEESRDWVDIAPRVVAGRAYRTILEAAESGPADLIVMGAQGRGGMRLALLGSTTQQVVRGATCPVLTVRGAADVPAG